jgi:NAD(P)-dependent dehydrogenase (short-subunit alcohol dehydrogenase family)
VAPMMVEPGWGRIVNVTTKLDTMNRPHTSSYGASKAALEMATEVWAKEVEGTGSTINIVRSIPTRDGPLITHCSAIRAATYRGWFPLHDNIVTCR